jgi:hypothetical protein
MFTTSSTVEPKILKELIAAGSVRHARVEPVQGGLVIVLQVGMNERTLGVARGGVRLLQSLDGAASVLQSYGIQEFSVNTRNWVPKTIVRPSKQQTAAVAA